MKTRLKTMSVALALTFMLLFGAVAFAHSTNTSMANPNMSSSGMLSAHNARWNTLGHRHHLRRNYMRLMFHRKHSEMQREMKGNR